MLVFIIITWHGATADLSLQDVKYLNELPLDKLIELKSSLQELVTDYNNVTTTPSNVNNFGAQAMALNAAPIKRTDYEGVYKKGGKESKLSTLFTMSVTTLAFLAFGGYLLCLIVQAVKAKENYNTTTVAPTFFVSAGIKKKPQNQFASYGRRKRQTKSLERSLSDLDLPPEKLFEALLQLCEGYAKWSERTSDVH